MKAALAEPQSNGGDAKGDTYISIENLAGSNHGDKLTGNQRSNTLDGGGGNDWLMGNGGDDKFVFDAKLSEKNMSTRSWTLAMATT